MTDERLRQCISCRALLPRNRLLKLTVNQNGDYSIDGRPPLQGRSAYVCLSTACLGEAIKAKKFHRTLKRAIPDAIVETLKERLKGLPPL